jgi:RNA polymerase sigma-70 factor (ECF subfamily)
MNIALEDAGLLARIKMGDKEAFATLVRRHSMRFYRIAYRFSGGRTEAEDIVQEAFLKLWERPNLWQEDRNTAFTTWFYRVLVNMCLDYRKKKRPVSLQDDSWVMDERHSYEETMLLDERERLLEEHIHTLPQRQRTALNLCFYEGLSNQEAADVMDINIKALQSLLMRAKATLKERIGEYYADREAV